MKMKNTMLDDLNVVVLAGGDPALRRADIDSDCITNVRILVVSFVIVSMFRSFGASPGGFTFSDDQEWVIY